jgi:hypothetical protein
MKFGDSGKEGRAAAHQVPLPYRGHPKARRSRTRRVMPAPPSTHHFVGRNFSHKSRHHHNPAESDSLPAACNPRENWGRLQNI